MSIHRGTLVTEKLDTPVQIGDIVRTFRGDVVKVVDWYMKPAPSEGRVVVKYTDNGQTMEYYPSVIGCRIDMNKEETAWYFGETLPEEKEYDEL